MRHFPPLSKFARPLALAMTVFTASWWLSPLAAAQLVSSQSELTLYGVRLKDVSVAALVSAAAAAGAKRLDQRLDGPLTFDTREAGVPALQRLTLITDQSEVVSAQFVIKSYGQENEALRQLLVQKYGLPTTADGARRPFPSFAGRFAPRGTFDWDFAGGMKVVYRQPVIGDATLSYTDIEKAQRLASRAGGGSPATKGDLANRF
jgi:hypothetical protein